MIIHSVHFAVNEELVLEDRLKALKDMGYRRQAEVTEPSSFTHRGGVLDVFPWGFSFPVRVAFEFDTVESIYSFDPNGHEQLSEYCQTTIKHFPELFRWQNLALYNYTGEVELGDSEQASVLHTFSNQMRDTDYPTKKFPCITIDDFCSQEKLTRLDFIKLDLEGSDGGALEVKVVDYH